jgi:cytochrome P450
MRALMRNASEESELWPQDPVAAVVCPNPYVYYADLVANAPIRWDEKLKLWVAASASAVTAVLGSPLCRVRPTAEPVPKALVGSPAGDIFGRLIRMNDGERHTPMNQAVGATLRSLALSRLTEHARQSASLLSHELRPAADIDRLSEFNFNLSAYVVASLLGVPSGRLSQTAVWLSDFVRCVAPSSTVEQVERGKSAAGHLIETFRALFEAKDGEPQSLLATLGREAKGVGRDDAAVIVANGIGFLSQAYEATAGLIGNTLLTLARHSWLREQVAATPERLGAVIDEVLRYDPPTHNTRRFVVEAGMVAGQAMKPGDAILVVVAAANYDPAVNPEPTKLDPDRQNRKIFTFGSAGHACPGAAMAATIAKAGVEELLSSGLPLADIVNSFTYRPSANTRVPLFSRSSAR